MQPYLVAVGNEYLSELLACDDRQQLRHAVHVQLVEQVVEQQYRPLALTVGEYGVLSQFQSDEERLLLPLRAVFAQRIAANGEHHVVAVYAACGKAVCQIALQRGFKQLRQRPLGELGAVFDAYRLALFAEQGVVVLDQRLHLIDDLLPAGVYGFAALAQQTVVYLDHGLLGLRFQQLVALGQCGIVSYQGGKITLVDLRYERVEVAAAFVGRVAYQRRVGGRHDHYGKCPDVVGEAFVLLAVAFERLAAAARVAATYLLLAAVVGDETAVEDEKLVAVPHALRIGHREHRLGHRQTVHRIEQVGLAGAVVADETVYAVRECEPAVGYVLEAYERYVAQYHKSCFTRSKIRFFSEITATAPRLGAFFRGKNSAFKIICYTFVI